MRNTQRVLCLTLFAAATAVAADDTAARLDRAATLIDTMTASEHAIPAAQIASADCIAVIPGFKKGAVVVGVGHGRGFISCRNGSTWSAPGGITLDSSSVGVQIGGEEIDIVVLSLDRERRSKLLSDRFAIGSDASAAWGNGKTAHADPNTKLLFYGRTKGAFAGFGLDGATLKPDDSGNQALYGKTMGNGAIVHGAETPAVAQAFLAKLTQAASR